MTASASINEKVRFWKINAMFFYAEALQPRDVTALT